MCWWRSYERFTLLRIKDLIQPDDKLLYLHTKGVRRDGEAAVYVYWWRTYMEYFLIKEHRLCLHLLEEHDTIGVNFRDAPANHYSGNFWWSRGDYFSTLQADNMDEGYLGPEFFLLNSTANESDGHNGHALWDTSHDWYASSFFPNEYVDVLLGGSRNLEGQSIT